MAVPEVLVVVVVVEEALEVQLVVVVVAVEIAMEVVVVALVALEALVANNAAIAAHNLHVKTNLASYLQRACYRL